MDDKNNKDKIYIASLEQDLDLARSNIRMAQDLVREILNRGIPHYMLPGSYQEKLEKRIIELEFEVDRLRKLSLGS